MTIIEKKEIISVSQALRQEFGTVTTKGAIIGRSKVFRMISKVEFYCDICKKLNEPDFQPPIFDLKGIEKRCEYCNKLTRNALNPFYKNSVIVELQDIDKFNELERLSVFLFDGDTEEIGVGEQVVITGDIHPLYIKKRSFTHLYADSLQYLNRERLTSTEQDRKAIKRFCRINENKKINVIDGLVELFDPSIIGYDHVKKGLLMSAVNTSETTSNKEKIHGLLIGDPGLAKSELVRRATEFIPGSNYVSAQNTASGKSLLAIIEKTDGDLFLRIGPVPQAKNAISGLNELGRMSFEDQGNLLDVMQEERFTVTAYAFNAEIKAPTTIIASANPVNNSRWKDETKIHLNEFPILGPLLDRFDLIFPFRSRKHPNEISEFGKKYSRMLLKKQKRQLPDYTAFLIQYVEYARQLNPVITEDAEIMLSNFYIEVKIKGFGSDRVLPTLHKLSKAVARLKLKEIVDEEDAKEAMEFYNVMLSEFQKSVTISKSPKEIAYQKCVEFLKSIDKGITIEELVNYVCEKNEQLAYYFGYNKEKSKMRNNIKIRDLYERLLNHSNIKRVQERPVVLQWLCDPYDVCDSDLESKTTKNNFINNDSKL